MCSDSIVQTVTLYNTFLLLLFEDLFVALSVWKARRRENYLTPGCSRCKWPQQLTAGPGLSQELSAPFSFPQEVKHLSHHRLCSRCISREPYQKYLTTEKEYGHPKWWFNLLCHNTCHPSLLSEETLNDSIVRVSIFLKISYRHNNICFNMFPVLALW